MQTADEKPFSVAVMDLGVKGNILTCLRERNCDLTIYPYGTSAETILAGKPDGIFLTNGPGDPEEATEAIEEVKKLISANQAPYASVYAWATRCSRSHSEERHTNSSTDTAEATTVCWTRIRSART